MLQLQKYLIIIVGPEEQKRVNERRTMKQKEGR